MKKIFAVVFIIILLSSLTACGSGEESLTVNPGVLTVATSPDYAPYEFYTLDENGDPHLAGFDMALAQYIADYLGLDLEIIPMGFNGILAEMVFHNADLALAGLTPDPDRLEAIDFSYVYYSGMQAFVTAADKAEQFSSLEDTNIPGLQIAAQTGSIQMELASENSPLADIIPLPKATDIIAELVSGSIDGAYLDYDVAAAYQKNYPQLAIAVEFPDEAQGNVIGVTKGNEELLALVNEAIAHCIADGSFARFVSDALEAAVGNTANYDNGFLVEN